MSYELFKFLHIAGVATSVAAITIVLMMDKPVHHIRGFSLAASGLVLLSGSLMVYYGNFYDYPVPTWIIIKLVTWFFLFLSGAFFSQKLKEHRMRSLVILLSAGLISAAMGVFKPF
jgi:hypothetical protein